MKLYLTLLLSTLTFLATAQSDLKLFNETKDGGYIILCRQYSF